MFLNLAVNCSLLLWTNDGFCGPSYGSRTCNNRTDENGKSWRYCNATGMCEDTIAPSNPGEIGSTDNSDYDYPEGCVDCTDILWTTNGRCGPEFDGQVCNNEAQGDGDAWTYCSDSNWCGNTTSHNDYDHDHDNDHDYDYPQQCSIQTLGNVTIHIRKTYIYIYIFTNTFTNTLYIYFLIHPRKYMHS